MAVLRVVRVLVSVMAVPLLLAMMAPSTSGQAAHVRWDIVSINFAVGTVSAGGMASALADEGSKITLTGAGTFVAPTGGGPSSAATGGGTWETFAPGDASTGRGTYRVTGLVRWEEAPGTLPGLTDLIGGGTPSAGLAVLRVAYSDGAEGILVVSCHLAGTPDTVFEGVTASKEFVTYWNRVAPVDGEDANRTLFHR